MAAKKTTKKTKARGATKRKDPLPWMRWFKTGAKVLLVVFCVGLTGVAAVYLSGMDWQPAPIEEVKLSKELIYQNDEQLSEVASAYIGRSLMFVDVAEVKSELEQLPWVYRVSVRKQWPGVLMLDVEEHEPVATWNDGLVLNSEGEPLENPSAFLELASLRGPINSSATVMNQYLQFAQVFENTGAGLQEVKMYPRGAWELKLDNGVLISLGDQNVVERSRRVVRVLNLEAYQEVEIEYIDARYSNGVAVKTAG